MKTCPVCNKQFADDVMRCPRDLVALPGPRTLVAHPPPAAEKVDVSDTDVHPAVDPVDSADPAGPTIDDLDEKSTDEFPSIGPALKSTDPPEDPDAENAAIDPAAEEPDAESITVTDPAVAETADMVLDEPPAANALVSAAEAETVLPLMEVSPAPVKKHRRKPSGELLSGIMEPGTTWGSYRLIKLLGKGGMGEVYLAQHTKLERMVALKLLRSRYAADRDAIQRFFREAKAVNKIRHPNIVEITDFIESDEGISYCIMEYLDGRSLGEMLAEDGIPPLEETLRIAIDICDALRAINGVGIIHRDLKPDNIFLTLQDDQPDRVKLLDFGLVKLTEAEDGSDPHPETGPRRVLGTPEYMSPEQLRGADVDPRSDLYSMGSILYEMLTRKRPLGGKTLGDLMANVATRTPKPPSSRLHTGAPPIPTRLEALIMRCLEKSPGDRPESAEALLTELRSIAGDLSVVGKEGVDKDVKITAPSPQQFQETAAVKAIQEERHGVGKYLVIGAAAIALAALVFAVTRGSRDPGKGAVGGQRQGAAIAKLSQLWGKVHHRPRQARAFAPAKQDMPLFHHDAVRTDNGARSKVTFDRGGWLEIDELSEVLIEEVKKEETPQGPLVASSRGMRLERGTIRAVAQPGAPIRFVTRDGKTTEVAARGDKPVAFRIKVRKDGKIELAVTKGQARVRNRGSAVNIGTNEVMEVVKGTFGARHRLLPFPELHAPTVDARLNLAQDAPATLRWSQVKGARSYRVQVSLFIGFDAKLVNRLVTSNELELSNLQPTTYTWRVSTVSASGHEGEFGFGRRFSVSRAAAETKAETPGGAAMQKPANNAIIEYAAKPRPVTLRWRPGGKVHLLVVARSKGLRRHVVVRRRLRTTRAKVGPLPPGVYYWGVYSADRAGKHRRLFKRPNRFVITQRSRPKVQLPTIEWK